MPERVITLLTDFGSVDTFVGQMKGVLYSHASNIAIVDLTHEIPVQDVRSGAIHLGAAWTWFPKGTIHVAVVDPGVGSSRTAICVVASEHVFLLPDNGLVSAVLRESEPTLCIALRPDQFTRQSISATFHGRDVFAVAAGLIASGTTPEDLGDPISPESLQTIHIPNATRAGTEIVGEVLMIDHFGNAVTNIPASMVGSPSASVLAGSLQIERISGTYSDAESGALLAMFSSIDTLEIAVRDGSAAKSYDLRVGDRVTVRVPERA